LHSKDCGMLPIAAMTRAQGLERVFTINVETGDACGSVLKVANLA